MSLKIESSTSPESTELIHNFMNGRYSGVLATADAAAHPHAAVVYYRVAKDFCVYLGTKRETQKFKNIEENKQVCLVVYDEVEQTTLQLFGRVEIVEDHDKKQEIIDNIFQSSAERSMTTLPPIEKLWGGEFVGIKIIPQVIKMAVYARPDSEGDDIFETILFSE